MNSQIENIAHQERPQSEIVAELTTSLSRHELPHSLEELQELTARAQSEWGEAGYGKVASFVGEEGDLVMTAYAKQSTPDARVQPQELRVSFDGRIVDTTILPGMRPEALTLRHGVNEIAIYDVSNSQGDDLPSGMEQLIEKFGERMAITTAADSRSVASLNRSHFRLDDITKRVRNQQLTERTRAETEAHSIERTAVMAAAALKKKVFTSAATHEENNLAAYKASIHQSLGQ